MEKVFGNNKTLLQKLFLCNVGIATIKRL